MYKLEILPICKKDIDDIIYYISHNLKNITAAKQLRNLLISSFDKILEFPYGIPVYDSVKVLKNEYRCFKVKNYLVFYIINEKKKIITIMRVLYKKMNFIKILE